MVNLDLLIRDEPVSPLADGVVLVHQRGEIVKVPVFTLSPLTVNILRRRAQEMVRMYNTFINVLAPTTEYTMFWTLRDNYRNNIFFFSNETKARHPDLANVGVVIVGLFSSMTEVVQSVQKADAAKPSTSDELINAMKSFNNVHAGAFCNSISAAMAVLERYSVAVGPTPGRAAP